MVTLEVPTYSELHYTRRALNRRNDSEIRSADIQGVDIRVIIGRRRCKDIVVEQIVRLPAELYPLRFRPG